MVDLRPAPPVPPHPTGADRSSGLRRAALCLYAAAFVIACIRYGVPLARELVMAWVCGALACLSIGRSWRQVGRIAADWLPFAGVLVLYDLSRGAADTLGMRIHINELIDAERFLFGDEIPTQWLQHRLVDFDSVRWWDVAFTVTYCSYFVVPFTVAGVLWARQHAAFVAYEKRFLTLMLAGLVTYVLYPAMPPWLAARVGVLPPVFRTAGRGWDALGLDVARRLVDHGQATTNLVAAMPSLHAGVTALVCLFLWPRLRWWWRPLLVAYPLAMGLALVATGEHYVIDIIAGFAYAAAVLVAWRWWDRRRDRPHVASAVRATER